MKNELSAQEPQAFYKQLLDRALKELRQLKELHGSVSMVSGPLRGKDGLHIKENLAIMHETIAEISKWGAMFDQTKYLDSEFTDAPHKVDLKMETFYKPLIQSGILKQLYILPGWEESSGTKKEIVFAEEAGLPIEYLDRV